MRRAGARRAGSIPARRARAAAPPAPRRAVSSSARPGTTPRGATAENFGRQREEKSQGHLKWIFKRPKSCF